MAAAFKLNEVKAMTDSAKRRGRKEALSELRAKLEDLAREHEDDLEQEGLRVALELVEAMEEGN